MKRFRLLLVLIVLVALAALYLPGYAKYLKLGRKEAALEAEINRLQTEISKLEKEERLIRTDVAKLEEVVRKELGFVKPGEIVVKVVEEEAPGKAESGP